MVRRTAALAAARATEDRATKAPDGVRQEHIRETRGIRQYRTAVGLIALTAAVVAAAIGVFGAPEAVRSASGTRAELEVHGPRQIRTGEFFEMRFRIDATEDLTDAVLGVDERIWQDITVNTMIPGPTDETYADGQYRFAFGELAAGQSFLFKVDAQINPDYFGPSAGQVSLYDGDELIAELAYELGVLP